MLVEGNTTKRRFLLELSDIMIDIEVLFTIQ